MKPGWGFALVGFVGGFFCRRKLKKKKTKKKLCIFLVATVY